MAITVGFMAWIAVNPAGDVLRVQAPSQQLAAGLVAGTVADETGGVLRAAARSELLNASGSVVRTTMSDASGRFQLTQVLARTYTLKARCPAEQPALPLKTP